MDGTELASRTGTSADRVTELTAAGVLTPNSDGSFGPADINRVRIAESLIAEGFALDDITRLLSINRLSFAPIDGLLASLMALDTRSLDDRVQETGSTIKLHVPETVLIGERMGEAPAFRADPATVTLPYSGLYVLVPDRYIRSPLPDDHRTEVQPDISVAFTAADYFGGRDPVLRRALK